MSWYWQINSPNTLPCSSSHFLGCQPSAIWVQSTAVMQLQMAGWHGVFHKSCQVWGCLMRCWVQFLTHVACALRTSSPSVPIMNWSLECKKSAGRAVPRLKVESLDQGHDGDVHFCPGKTRHGHLSMFYYPEDLNQYHEDWALFRQAIEPQLPIRLRRAR